MAITRTASHFLSERKNSSSPLSSSWWCKPQKTPAFCPSTHPSWWTPTFAWPASATPGRGTAYQSRPRCSTCESLGLRTMEVALVHQMFWPRCCCRSRTLQTTRSSSWWRARWRKPQCRNPCRVDPGAGHTCAGWSPAGPRSHPRCSGPASRRCTKFIMSSNKFKFLVFFLSADIKACRTSPSGL